MIVINIPYNSQRKNVLNFILRGELCKKKKKCTNIMLLTSINGTEIAGFAVTGVG